MRGAIALTLLGMALTGPAWAQGSTAAMAEVKEVLLQYANIANTEAAGQCSLSRESLNDDLQRNLKLGSVPIILVNEAKPAMLGVARIELLPEIVTIYFEGLGCTSWISLAAQSKHSLKIPPVETPRSITVSYWRSGLMVSTNISSHSRLVAEAFQKLAKKFADQYRLDQPPPLPSFDTAPSPSR
jgi:hypothetical protein